MSGEVVYGSTPRTRPPPLQYVLESAYVINGATGSDKNAGTARAPLKTLAEWGRRVGSQLIDAVMTVTYSNLLATDHPRGEINVGDLGDLEFIAVPTTIYTSTGAGVTAVAAVPGGGPDTPWLITDSNLPAATWATWLNQGGASPFRIRTTAGASHVGAVAFPLYNVSGKQAAFMTPSIPDETLGPFGQSRSSIASGDPFVLEQLPVLGCGFTFNVSPVALVNGKEHVRFKDCAFGTTLAQMQTSDIGFGTQIGFYGCDMGLMVVRGGGDFLNCRWGQLFAQAEDYLYLFGGGCCGTFTSGNCEALNVDFQFAVQGSQFTSFGAAGFVGACQVWNWPSSGAFELHGGRLEFQAIFDTRKTFGYQAGGTKFGIRIKNASQATYINTTGLTITGGGGDVQLGTPATIKAYSALPFVDTYLAGMVVL